MSATPRPGWIGSVTLGASALGGWLGGALADRIGRVRALQVTILWFAIATFVSAFTQSFEQLLVVKGLQGLGFGAEWAAGAVLMSEVIHPEHRGKALGAVQSGWAVGWGASVVLYAATFSLLPAGMAWRVVFALGLLPALLVFYLRRRVPEPARSVAALRKSRASARRSSVFSGLQRFALPWSAFCSVSALMAATTACSPGCRLSSRRNVISPSSGTGGYLGVIIVAYWLGCVVAGQLLDRLGRRCTVSLFAVGCVALTIIYLLLPISPTAMLLLGFPLGFCAAGIPASMGTLFTELYPERYPGVGSWLLLQRRAHHRRRPASRDRLDERRNAARRRDRH